MTQDPGSIILASSSPRRRELLSQAGVAFSIIVPGCDETPIPGESPQQLVERLAEVKAAAIAEIHRDSWVVGADTTVCIDGECLGKPESFDDAVRMLKTIQGRTHQVWGGFSVVRRFSNTLVSQSHMTSVTMAPMSDEVIRWYVSSGEPLDKAGSYAIQGLGLQFVDSITGSYSNVVGLNISAVMDVLTELGIVDSRKG